MSSFAFVARYFWSPGYIPKSRMKEILSFLAASLLRSLSPIPLGLLYAVHLGSRESVSQEELEILGVG